MLSRLSITALLASVADLARKMAQQRWQQGSALPFGASSSADADDYYDFLPSDDDTELSGDEEISGDTAALVAGQQDIATLASVPLTGRAVGGGNAAVATTKVTTSSAVLTPIGVLGAGDGARDATTTSIPTQETLALVASGAVTLAGGKQQLRTSSESLAQHASRKSQLETALDAFAISTGTSHLNTASLAGGEAPFRFRAPTSADVEMVDAQVPVVARPATRSTKQEQHVGDQMSSKAALKKTAASGETSGETDPLYDDSLDDADEKWVQRNFRTFLFVSSYSQASY